MKKKILIAAGSVCAAIVTLWGVAFVTDYIRVTSFREPVFVVAAGDTADDGGSGTYYGLGYTVEVEKYVDAEYGVVLSSVEMRMFGKVIAAAIT